MMECPSCHRQTAAGRFCERCGAPLDAGASPVDAFVSNASDRDGSHRFDAIETIASTGGRSGTIASTGGRPEKIASTEDRFKTIVPERNNPSHVIDIEERLRMAEERVRAAESRVEREVGKVDLYANERGEPTLAYDRTCSLFEDMSGIVRFRFNPTGGGDRVENVVIEFGNAALECPLVQQIRHATRPVEFSVQFPPQTVGLQSWSVHLAYQSSRRKHELAGQFQIVVRPVASRGRAAGTYNISFNTSVGNVGHASDVNIHSSGAEGLADLLRQDDPFEEMQRIARSSDRQWVDIPFSDDNAVVDLPEMPEGAKTDRIVLDFGDRRVHLFAGSSLRFGRTRETNDFVLRPPAGAGEEAMRPYRMVSRQHCLFEQAGLDVRISDGSRDAMGVMQPSSGGTYWNDGRICGSVRLESNGSGVLSFGAPSCAGGLSLKAKACAPTRACATCPHSNIHWCGEGKHPSLLLKRTDGIAECFVALWSCLWLGEAEPAFEGAVIFRKDGAFAFRDGSRSGWLAPGTTIQSDFGPVKVS